MHILHVLCIGHVLDIQVHILHVFCIGRVLDIQVIISDCSLFACLDEHLLAKCSL